MLIKKSQFVIPETRNAFNESNSFYGHSVWWGEDEITVASPIDPQLGGFLGYRMQYNLEKCSRMKVSLATFDISAVI